MFMKGEGYINWYDYGARFYDPEIARFHTIDPLAAFYSFQSPYAYAANNPIRYIDYMGFEPQDYKPTGEGEKSSTTGWLVPSDDVSNSGADNHNEARERYREQALKNLFSELQDAEKRDRIKKTAANGGGWSDTYNFNRIGFVPLDEKVGYQMANYRMNFRASTSMVPIIGKDYSMQGQQRVLTISAISRTTLVSGDVTASASATLIINGNTISSQSLLPSGTNLVNAGSYYIGSVSFNIPNSGNIQVGLQGGWVVSYPGGRSVPVYHPLGAPFPININTTITIPGL